LKQESKLTFIEIYNILLEKSHKGLYFCNWKLFNERSYEKVMNLQSYENYVFPRELGPKTWFLGQLGRLLLAENSLGRKGLSLRRK
jgi:hypothetical protein